MEREQVDFGGEWSDLLVRARKFRREGERSGHSSRDAEAEEPKTALMLMVDSDENCTTTGHTVPHHHIPVRRISDLRILLFLPSRTDPALVRKDYTLDIQLCSG